MTSSSYVRPNASPSHLNNLSIVEKGDLDPHGCDVDEFSSRHPPIGELFYSDDMPESISQEISKV